jgi:hypothetical protein
VLDKVFGVQCQPCAVQAESMFGFPPEKVRFPAVLANGWKLSCYLKLILPM